MREMELISTNGDVIDSLKQANPAQLILHSFPGQVALKERERESEREIRFSNVPLSEALTVKCVYQCFLIFSSIYYSIQRFYSPIRLKIQWTYED